MAELLPKADISKCSICLEGFKIPKLLPCFHTFCETCIDVYISKSQDGETFNCPLCRTTLDIPKNGAKGFQSNFYIEAKETSQVTAELPCHVCGPKAQAIHKCTECEEIFCSTCSYAHSKMKATCNHTLLELKPSDVLGGRKIISRSFCPRHPNEEIKVVCQQCDELLCIVCKLTCHDNHTSDEIPARAKKVREQLLACIGDSSFQAKIDFVKKERGRLEKRRANVSETLHMDLQSVDDQERKLCAAVSKRFQSIRDQIKEKVDKRLQENENVHQSFGTELNSATSLQDIAKLALDHDNDIEIIKKGPSLCSKLTNIAKSPQADSCEVAVESLYLKGSIEQEALVLLTGNVREEADKTYKKETKRTIPTSGPELVSKIKVGTRVVRGKDWEYGNEDGGKGKLGTVIDVDGGFDGKSVSVKWDCGDINGYRIGAEGAYDLYIAEI